MLASFGIGGDFYDGNYQALMGGIRATGNNASVALLNSWRSTADAGDGHTPILRTQLNYGSQTSTRFLYDHTFLRVRNITLGYTFAPTQLERIKLRSARIYFNVQNPFTFFPNAPTGADPDSGIDARAINNNTTTNRFISFGLNLRI